MINGIDNGLHSLQALRQHAQSEQQQSQQQQPQQKSEPQAQQKSQAAAPASSSEPSYNPYYMSITGSAANVQAAPASQDAPAITADEITQDSLTNISPAAQDIQATLNVYENAQNAAKAADEELQAQLAEVGPSLTEEQKQAYIAAYHEQHASVYDTETAAAETLTAKLSDPTLIEAARTDPAVAAEIESALTHLAEGNHGSEVLSWLAANMQSSNDFGFSASTYETLVTDALNSASASAVASSDPASALDDVLQSLNQLKSLNNAPKAVLDAASTMEDLKKAMVQGASAVEALFQAKGYEPNANPSLMSAAYLMAMAHASSGLIQGLDTSDPNVLVDFGSTIATLAQGGAEKVAEAAKNGSKFLDNVTGRINSSLGTLSQNANAIAKIMHGAAGVLGAFAAVVDFADYLNDPNADAWDGLSAVGSLLSAVPLPWIAGLGSILSVAGEVAGAIAERSGRAEEQAKLLKKAGLSADAAQAIAYDPSAGVALAEAGLSPEEIQELADTHPGLFEPTDHAAEAFAKAIASMGLTGKDAIALADAMSENGTNEEIFAELAINAKAEGELDGLKSGAAIATLLANAPPNSLFSAANAYLQEHHPYVIQQAADQAQASEDFKNGSANVQGKFAANLAEHNSDAYGTQIVAMAKKKGTLDMHVQDAADNGSSDEKTAVADALTAAYNAGEIDYSTANAYLKKLDQPGLPSPTD